MLLKFLHSGNPSGVAFKLQNLRQVATGKGLAHVSATDRAVWAEFGHDRNALKAAAGAIRKAMEAIELEPPDELQEEFAEGRILTELHYRRERNPAARKKLLNFRRAHGLSCEICHNDYSWLAEDLRDAAFEAHHILPIGSGGERKTKIVDLAVLCASCHRLLHRAMVVERRWVSVDEAAHMLQGGPRNTPRARIPEQLP